jgi:predicted nuclease with RNAse H fold
MKKGLVEMKLDGEIIEVHPAAVEAHKQAGWKLVDPADQIEIIKSGLVAAPAGTIKGGKLVKMFNGKDGATSEVHPDAVAAHIKVGWNIVDAGYLKVAVETAQAKKPTEKAVANKTPPAKNG